MIRDLDKSNIEIVRDALKDITDTIRAEERKTGQKYYYINNVWCDEHGQKYLNEILDILK
jgi:hypothetical protein